jgi:hypothetical protein
VLLPTAAEVAGWQLMGTFEHVNSRDLVQYIKMFVFYLESSRKTYGYIIRNMA